MYRVALPLLNDPTEAADECDAMTMALALVYKEAQEGPWSRLRGNDITQWMQDHRGAVHVLDSLEVVALDGRSLTVSVFLPEMELERAGSSLILVGWGGGAFLSGAVPLEQVVPAVKKRGKKAIRRPKGSATPDTDSEAET